MDGAGDVDWGQGCGENCFTLDGDGFICHRVLDAPEVWRVELLMHDTFLPSVNAFVVRDGGETLVVDSGTPDDFNDTRLMRALLGLGVDPEGATVFFTHAHIDHTGLARELSEAERARRRREAFHERATLHIDDDEVTPVDKRPSAKPRRRRGSSQR